MTDQVDTVTMTVVSNYLRNVCQEMGVAMMRTSFSTIFNEGLGLLLCSLRCSGTSHRNR